MKGEVVHLYSFDVANEIVTSRIQHILGRQPAPFEIRTDHPSPKDAPLYKPLALEAPSLTSKLSGPVRVFVRVYEVGVVTIAFHVSFECDGLMDLMPYHRPLLEDGRTFDQAAQDLCERTAKSLSHTMIGGSSVPEPEAYTIFCINELESVEDVNLWIDEQVRDLAGLLTETQPEQLSETQVHEVVRIRRSFENTEAVIIDWDAAVIIDLKGYMDDVLYVLELANIQLEEFRVMDQRLDRYLDRAYEDLDRRRPGLFGVSAAFLRSLRAFAVDVTKLNDDVSHFVKFFGDWHLARVYLGANERFYLDHWRQSVQNRLGQLDNLYTVLNSELYNKRLLVLEILIVIFFAIDILLLLFGKR